MLIIRGRQPTRHYIYIYIYVCVCVCMYVFFYLIVYANVNLTKKSWDMTLHLIIY